ncbi:growth-blocking peptide, long form-like [Vanessa atalanta]|uniref:growth-blocking peptide, long form-like n=1 Tax=Vanessa atalanta TaxID=42275 RepID=UPI001FCD278F|nr:growth-blocking peptide, long form-like [Vanessa atalanta]
MKTVYCFCLIVNTLLLVRNSDAGLVRDIFGSVHDAAHKVRDDIHQTFYPKQDQKKETVDVVHVADNKNNDNNQFVFVTTSTAATVNKEVSKEPTGFVMPKDDDETKFVFPSMPTTEATVNITSTTVKDGRENFAGGCSTGYERTADGRCKPTF